MTDELRSIYNDAKIGKDCRWITGEDLPVRTLVLFPLKDDNLGRSES